MVGTSSWKQQFSEALTLEPEEEGGEIKLKEKIIHYFALPWKLLFALIPPTDYYNGKLTTEIQLDWQLFQVGSASLLRFS